MLGSPGRPPCRRWLGPRVGPEKALGKEPAPHMSQTGPELTWAHRGSLESPPGAHLECTVCAHRWKYGEQRLPRLRSEGWTDPGL